MSTPSRVVGLLVVTALSGCGGTSVDAPADRPPAVSAAASPTDAAPSPVPSPAEPQLTEVELEALLLQPADVPQVPLHFVEVFPGPLGPPEPETVPDNVCRPPLEPQARAVATFLTQPYTEPQTGPSVVQRLLVWPDEDAARQAYASAQEAASTCGTYSNPYGVSQEVTVLGPVDVPAPAEAFQYEQRQVPTVPVPGDVTTVVRAGRVLLTLDSSIRAPAGLSVSQWQGQLAARAAQIALSAGP